jgi:hypothetical protein
MSTFEFDDVIATAKVIVNPEASAAELKRLGIENAQLRAELDEWENAKKFVADGCKDELHCGCVPILKRELDEAISLINTAEININYLNRKYGSSLGISQWVADKSAFFKKYGGDK